jgi:PAS domain S-box-containing protein
VNLQHSILFDTLAELSPIGIFVADSDGVCSYVNKRWCEISEVPIDQALGKVWYDVVHPNDRTRVLATWDKSKEKQCEFELEYRFQTVKTKSIVWIHGRALPVINQSTGRIDFYVGTVADTTVHRTLTEELEKSRKFLDSVIENIPNMLFVKEAKELKFVRFNRAGEELLGIKRQELLGKNDFDLFPKEQAESFTKKDRSVLKGQRAYQLLQKNQLTPKTQRTTVAYAQKKSPILDELGHAPIHTGNLRRYYRE